MPNGTWPCRGKGPAGCHCYLLLFNNLFRSCCSQVLVRAHDARRLVNARDALLVEADEDRLLGFRRLNLARKLPTRRDGARKFLSTWQLVTPTAWWKRATKTRGGDLVGRGIAFVPAATVGIALQTQHQVMEIRQPPALVSRPYMLPAPP